MTKYEPFYSQSISSYNNSLKGYKSVALQNLDALSKVGFPFFIIAIVKKANYCIAPKGLSSLLTINYLPPSVLTTSQSGLGVEVMLTFLMEILLRFHKTDLETVTPLLAKLLKFPPATKIMSLNVFKIYLLWLVILFKISNVKLVRC